MVKTSDRLAKSRRMKRKKRRKKPSLDKKKDAPKQSVRTRAAKIKQNTRHIDFQKLFTDTLLSSENLHTESKDGQTVTEEWIFSPSQFFAEWFRSHGSAYYFLFRKNLKVTNIQFAELLALIRAHNHSRETNEPVHDLQFLSVDEFYSALTELVDSFPRSSVSPRARHELIARMYYALMSRHVVVEAFYGSCAVFVPPNLEIDLSLICAHSGYVHSCGKNIFTRKIDKARKEELFEALDKHFAKERKYEKAPFFIVYAHEDFTSNEKPEKKEYLRDGLDDVKIFVEKFYMDAERLVDVVEAMRERYAGKLFFLAADKKTPSDTIRAAVDEDKEFDHHRTIWLLVDHSVGEAVRQRGDDRLYICYEQHFVNENPFQFFDENKPAWLSHTTIPHTLLAAMINVTGLSAPREESMVLVDPFAGTGTTWIEAIKLKQVEARCTDKSPVAPLLATDNLHFFRASFDTLRHWREQLDSLVGYLTSPAVPHEYPSASLDVVKDYNWVIEFYDEWVGKSDYLTVLDQPERIAVLKRQPFLRHLFFYLTLRTVGRSSVAIKRGSQEWKFAFATQALHLARQVGLLQEARHREETFPVRSVDHFTFYQSLYSLASTVSLSRLAAFGDGAKERSAVLSNETVGVYDVTNEETSDGSSLRSQSCDVIITDPPYGFNTDDDLEDLAELYADAIQKMIHALKQDGQLVICLLDRSHTGRRSPYFTHKELITQQVLSLAECATPKREVIIPAYAVPEQRDLFRPPYYWESERALRRAILHFKIRIIEGSSAISQPIDSSLRRIVKTADTRPLFSRPNK
ncbi:MAG: hypothetical protein QOH41_1338 [Blastocatellia bacterium]|jgi:tRNA G10  N-methylase Trm11|nr:hypothetical protein [Blastocatellia bacterium]